MEHTRTAGQRRNVDMTILQSTIKIIIVCIITEILYRGIFYIAGKLILKANADSKLAIRLIAMSYSKNTDKYCKQDCQNTKCGNWTCSQYHNKKLNSNIQKGS